MGSIVNRGTRSEPKWLVKYKDVDGRYKMRLSRQSTKEQARQYLAEIESRVAKGKIGIESLDHAPRCKELMEQWAGALTNRNAKDDENRMKKHLLPVFGALPLPHVTMAKVMEWIDAQRAAETLSEASIRHNLNLLSRFFSWAIERGHTTINPVRQIPQGRRPQQAQKRDVPWLQDDDVVRALFHELPEPINLMFYLGNRSGLRTGEAAGLRMADLDSVDQGAIRVRFSYGGALKEDKRQTGLVKWAPAVEDAAKVLGPWLEKRRAQGAGPEDLVFPCPTRGGSWYRKEFIEQCWEDAAEKHELKLTWYQATRHSFTSRNLDAGASLDEVSAALGHSSPVVTKRYYDHLVRKSFSATLRQGLDLGEEQNGGLIPLQGKRSRRPCGTRQGRAR